MRKFVCLFSSNIQRDFYTMLYFEGRRLTLDTFSFVGITCFFLQVPLSGSEAEILNRMTIWWSGEDDDIYRSHKKNILLVFEYSNELINKYDYKNASTLEMSITEAQTSGRWFQWRGELGQGLLRGRLSSPFCSMLLWSRFLGELFWNIEKFWNTIGKF